MKFEEIKDIIDFAVKKEQEAVDFYRDLAAKVKIKAIADEIRKIALMEEAHRERLRKMDIACYAKNAAHAAINLRIADYLADKEPSPEMTWQDLIQIAMRRELSAVQLYTDLAKFTADPQAKQIFENLAAEEGQHKLFFEKIWDEDILTDN
jgi:rubrerythrin